MSHTTVRISARVHDTLRDLARADGRPMQALLEEAVEALRRKRFLEQVNAAFTELRGNARAWADVERERRVWEATLTDGLAVHEGRERYGPGRKARGRKRRLRVPPAPRCGSPT